VSRALTAIALVCLPAVAEACASCIGSPFGDRTYNWPYLLLILVPFVLLTVIGGVMARVSGVRVSTLRRRLARLFHPAARQEETT
jgi:uncharacterized integral membrane protein